MKTSNATLLGIAALAGLAVLLKRNKSVSGIGAATSTYTRSRLNIYLDTLHIEDLVAEYKERNKVLCMAGDEMGGRDFYLNRSNFIYLFNYCLMRNVPIAVWTGDHWLTRNGGDELLGDGVSGIGKINPNRNGTRVIFRTFKSGLDKGEVIALFPDELWMGADHWNTNYVASYMHVGQHAGADYLGVMQETKPATEQEYTPLLRELKSIGYDDLIIAKKR